LALLVFLLKELIDSVFDRILLFDLLLAHNLVVGLRQPQNLEQVAVLFRHFLLLHEVNVSLHQQFLIQFLDVVVLGGLFRVIGRYDLLRLQLEEGALVFGKHGL